MSKLRIAITGATGLLGRNLLFEFIKCNLKNLDALEIFILGRDKFNMGIEQRIKRIILNDGIEYLALKSKEQIEKLKEYCNTGIKYIDIDLDEDRLDIKPEDLKKLKADSINFFFHIAALTDFRDTPVIVEALKRTNIHGTQQILQLVSALKVEELCYTGTAYSCGMTSGNIKPDYINFNQSFRNPYEHTKLESEVLIRDFAKKTGTRCRYFRPSTISGRLIEQPPGSINKFDVFYSWAAFFLRLKLKNLKNVKDKYKDSITLDMRICYSLKSGLNIVPADYAAKVIYHVCAQNDPGENYYLVNGQETPHRLYVGFIFKDFNISGTKQAESIPLNMNYLERLYYKTVGKVFTPYTISGPMLFNIENLTGVLTKAKLKCPIVNEKNFSILCEYAKKYDFGISSGKDLC